MICSAHSQVEMISMVDVDDEAAVETAIANYKALQGTLVTVADDLDNETENVLVLDVAPVSARRIATAVGKLSTSANYMLVCRWMLLPTS